jgi:hypothetical protein
MNFPFLNVSNAKRPILTLMALLFASALLSCSSTKNTGLRGNNYSAIKLIENNQTGGDILHEGKSIWVTDHNAFGDEPSEYGGIYPLRSNVSAPNIQWFFVRGIRFSEADLENPEALKNRLSQEVIKYLRTATNLIDPNNPDDRFKNGYYFIDGKTKYYQIITFRFSWLTELDNRTPAFRVADPNVEIFAAESLIKKGIFYNQVRFSIEITSESLDNKNKNRVKRQALLIDLPSVNLENVSFRNGKLIPAIDKSFSWEEFPEKVIWIPNDDFNYRLIINIREHVN